MTARGTAKSDVIRAMAAQGMSQTTIADHMGLTRTRIWQICKRDGIETLSGNVDWDRRDGLAERIAAGDSVEDAAKAAGYSYAGAWHAIKAMGLEPAEQPKRWHEIRDAAAEGLTLSECARRMGRSVQAVWNEAARHGIVFTAKGRPGNPGRRVDRAEVHRLRAEGLSRQQVAMRVGCSANAIYRIEREASA